MRYVLVTIIIFTMLGSVASMYAFSYTIYFKWPDYYVEAHGRPNTCGPYGFGNWFVYVARPALCGNQNFTARSC